MDHGVRRASSPHLTLALALLAGLVAGLVGSVAGQTGRLSEAILRATSALEIVGTSSQAVSAANEGRLYYDTEDDVLYLSENAAAYRRVGSGLPFLVWTADGNHPPATGFATGDRRNAHPVLDYDADSTEDGVFAGVLAPTYTGGGLTLELFWMATSATTGAVKWEGAIERHAEDAFDLDADGFAATQTVTTTTADLSGELKQSTMAFADGAQMDNLAAGESFRLLVRRDATHAGDTMTGDAEAARVVLRETP